MGRRLDGAREDLAGRYILPRRHKPPLCPLVRIVFLEEFSMFLRRVSKSLRKDLRRSSLVANKRKLRFETCERRIVLTTYIVDTLTDDADDALIGSADGQLSLREAINAANSDAAFGDAEAGSSNVADVILFSQALSGGTIALNNGQLSIGDSVIIDASGLNLTIDAQGDSRIFSIDAAPTSAVALRGLRLTGGNATLGGAVLVTTAGALAVDQVTFEANGATGGTATQGGGAIYNVASDLLVKNSIFRNNTASGTSGSGGAIFSTDGDITLLSSTVEGNIAVRAGGGIELIDGKITIIDSSLNGNVAGQIGNSPNPGNGGGLHVTGLADVLVINSAVNGNSAASEGGGLWNGSGMMTLTGVTLRDNVALGNAADNGGGAIFNNAGNVYVTDSLIASNRASGTSGSGGGIFSVIGTVAVYDSNIVENRANRAGGGIETIDGTLMVVRSNLAANIAGPAGGANPGNGGAVHITGATDTTISLTSVVLNSAGSEGGGLWNSASGTMQVSASTIRDNSALGNAADNGGGGIFNNGGDMTIRLTNISRNSAYGTSGSGGGLLTVDGDINIVGATIRDNMASRAGGGVEIIDGSLFMALSSLENNIAGPEGSANPGSGGGLHVTGNSTFTKLFSSIVVGNIAANQGGGLWNQAGSRMEVHGTSVVFNSARGAGGGGIWNNGGVVDLILANISFNNASSGQGGGLYLGSGGTLTSRLSSVYYNNARQTGGGIYNAADAVFANDLIQFNNADGDGGGIFGDTASTNAISTSVVSNNTPNNTAGSGMFA